MAANVVCAGAMCACDMGEIQTPLAVTSQQLFRINGQLVATIADNQPVTNITPFGQCMSTQKPCAPAPAGPWAPAAVVGLAANQALITLQSQLACTEGGKITIASGNCNVDCNVQ
ncbi:MAG: PAAR-like protein [Gemmataceae bacterium]